MNAQRAFDGGPDLPVLVLVSGLPGVGKSALVNQLAPRLRAAVVPRDAARLGLARSRLPRLTEALVWRVLTGGSPAPTAKQGKSSRRPSPSNSQAAAR